MNTYESLLMLAPSLAREAQIILNQWRPPYPSNGKCGEIARKFGQVVTANIPSLKFSTTAILDDEGADHTVALFTDADGKEYTVDIPPEVYEYGAGYLWTKKPGVVLTPEDVVIREV